MQERGISKIFDRAWDHTLKDLPTTGKWSAVNGPMSSAIATLTDLDWTPSTTSMWTDPDGSTWALDYSDPMLPDILKEVLHYHTPKFIWRNHAAHHYAGIGVVPDFSGYRHVKKIIKKKGDPRQQYYLESIVHGSCVAIADNFVTIGDDDLPTCTFCKQTVTGCAFKHVAYCCPATNSLEHPGIQDSAYIVDQAQVELAARPAFWLSGRLFPLEMLDP